MSLEELSQDLSRREPAAKAANFLSAMEKGEFIVALLICENILSYTFQLSISLQDKSIDFFKAMKQVENIVGVLENTRKDAIAKLP